ncbi:hypothetical protein K1719_026555 [Acacia pycnantha]|nr:hypothetical protein K1719_026555 [Acacia pycnantha]
MAADKPSSLQPMLSKEEDDQLRRSAKKIKNSNVKSASFVDLGQWPLLGQKGSHFVKGGPSFAEKLKGKTGDEDSSDEEGVPGENELTDDHMRAVVDL